MNETQKKELRDLAHLLIFDSQLLAIEIRQEDTTAILKMAQQVIATAGEIAEALNKGGN